MGETQVMISGGITNDWQSGSNVYPCRIYGLRVNANAILCVRYAMWTHSRCARVKMVTPRFRKICLHKIHRKCWGDRGAGSVGET